MKVQSNSNRADRRGATIVIVALLMAAVAMLSLTLLTTLRSSQQENQGSRENLSALYMCEAGLSAAVRDLAVGGTGDLGTANNPIDSGDQSYWVQGTPLGNGRTSLRAVGRDDRAEMGVEVVVQPDPDSFFRWAAFGEELLHMDSNARTDSYRSDIEPDGIPDSYQDQAINDSGSNAYANTNGDVGSSGNITMDSNIGVYGDASPGPTGTVTGDIPNIMGSIAPMPSAVELPDIIVPAIDTDDSAFSSSLPSGNYHFSNFTVPTTETLTITGPAKIVCDYFMLEPNSNVKIDATDGKVEFYVINDFVLKKNTQIFSATYSPLDVAFNLLSDNILDPGIDVSFDEDVVAFESNSKLYGTIFAPSAEITIKSNFEQFGSLVARRVSLRSNARIHYDELLATVSQDAQNVFTTLCWRVVPLP